VRASVYCGDLLHPFGKFDWEDARTGKDGWFLAKHMRIPGPFLLVQKSGFRTAGVSTDRGVRRDSVTLALVPLPDGHGGARSQVVHFQPSDSLRTIGLVLGSDQGLVNDTTRCLATLSYDERRSEIEIRACIAKGVQLARPDFPNAGDDYV